ncbi:uncharacterized protein LOC141907388 [Tubulanus polymorphus]|uniref:uncharacterized protein LOC141907388 n=1 Tax=Tubulanus polymorphus TaxID=672921 RepID=UPI003DA1E6D6
MTLDHIRQEFSMDDDNNDIEKDIRSSDAEDHFAEKTNTEFDGDSFDKKSNAILPSENEEERSQFDHDSLNSTTENVNQDNLNSNVVEKENSTIEEGPVERFDQDSLDAENRPISQEKNCNSRLYVDQKQEMLTLSKRCSIVCDIPLRKRRRKSDIICGRDGTTVGTIENAQESNLDFLKQLVDTPDSKEETEHIGTKTNGKDAPQNRGKSSNIRNRPAGKQVAPKQVNTTNKTTKDKINKDTKAKVVAKSKTATKNDKDTSKIHDSSPKEDTPPKVIRRRQDSSTGVIPPPVPSKTLKPSSNKRADTTKVQARKSSMDVVRATKPAPIRRAQSHDAQRADKTPIQKTNTASADKANDSRSVPRHKDKPSSAPAPTKRLQPVNKRSAAPKPVLKRSSISLDNRSTPWAKADFVPIRKDKKYVENHKVEWKSDARVNSLQNVGYKPKREEKKFVVHHRLKWNAVSKVAALMKHTQKKRQLAENGGSIETPSDDQKSTTSKQDQNRSAPKNGKGNRPHGRKGSNATKDSNDVAVTEDIGQAIDDTKTEQSIDKKDSETGSAAVTPVDTSTKDAISSNTGNINDNVDQERNEIITTDTETTADAADEQVNFEDSGREQSVTEHPDDDLADKIQQHE